MRKENISKAIDAAQEFINRAEEVFDLPGINGWATGSEPKLTGALRRQSMELTRALSKMRNDR